MEIETIAGLLDATISELSRRAPAIVASAARQLGHINLALHFGDDSHAELMAVHSRLVVNIGRSTEPHVEAYFDHRSMNLLFDLERRPVDELWASSLDVRGERGDLLAVWRTFELLSQRASGLRAVQTLWRKHRDRKPALWGFTTDVPAHAKPDTSAAMLAPIDTGWRALDYLDHHNPENVEHPVSTVGGSVLEAGRILWDGRRSLPWWNLVGVTDADLMDTMSRCKNRVRDELLRIIPDREPRAHLYDLMRVYPSREGKGLRPTLTIASCCAFGGRPEDAVRTAAALELFHNGFLVHDDIADESTHRRNEPTLHEAQGVGLAVNTGDGMHLLAIDSVLSNLPTLGLSITLGLIHEIMHMCRETVEGQAIELGWIREQYVPERDEDYHHMSTKKTGWYTCLCPCRLGAICAGVTDPATLDHLNETFRLVGIAFQIQDDVLNLIGDEVLYGKEPMGDLLEGKRTIMMIHLFKHADPDTRARLQYLIGLSRTEKNQGHAEEIFRAMKKYGSIDYAIGVAERLAHEGVKRFEEDLAFLAETEAKGVLRQVANYVTTRPL